MAVTVGALPGGVDWQGKRGDKWGPLQFTERSALDLSGRTWLAQVRKTLDQDSEVLATITIDDTNADTGVILATIDESESIAFDTGPAATPDGVTPAFQPGKATYHYDITDTTNAKTYFTGKIKVFTGDMAGAF